MPPWSILALVLTSSVQGVAVAGGNTGTDGVTVLGKAVVQRVGCESDRQ